MKKHLLPRRHFLKQTLHGTIIAGTGLTSMSEILSSCSSTKAIITSGYKTSFTQQPLPYDFSALEDVIDAKTMEIHYTKHAAGYAKNLQEAAAAEGFDASKGVEAVLSRVSKFSTKVRNSGGGHYNHELFWKCMRPKQENNKPNGELLKAIEKNFTSFEDFKTKFSDAGKNRFGSGWAWLYVDDRILKVGSTPNQDNILMDVSEIKGFPLLALDVWEHAYYLKYQNKRNDYITNWWNVVNWSYVQERFNKLTQRNS